MDERLAIQVHLNDFPVDPDGQQYKSSFVALLADARQAAERDSQGNVVDGKRSHSWLGAVAYMVLLDQIGGTFARRDLTVQGDNNIERALRYFSPINDPATLDALYALRLTLAHDYALFNENQRNPLRQHAFNFVADEVAPLVSLPWIPWDGVYRIPVRIPPEQVTIVNLRRLGDLVESVVARVRDFAEPGGDLIINPALSVDKFHLKYGIIYRP